MDGFNIGKIILGLQNPELFIKKNKKEDANKVNSFAPEINTSLANSKPQNNQLLQNIQSINNITQILQMNSIANMDRSLFSGKIIPGIELRTSCFGVAIELLGYGFDIDKMKEIL